MIGTVVGILKSVVPFMSGIFFTVSHPDITGSFLDFTDIVKTSAMNGVSFLGGLVA